MKNPTNEQSLKLIEALHSSHVLVYFGDGAGNPGCLAFSSATGCESAAISELLKVLLKKRKGDV